MFNNIELFNLFDLNISNFYCISSKHENLSIGHLPNIGEYNIFLYPIIKKNSIYTPEKIKSLIMCESDIIDHNNKNKPISYYFGPSYTQSYSSTEYISINFHLQYIKYESDTGLIFKNYKTFEAKSFTNLDYFHNLLNNYDFKNDSIGSINIIIDNFFDHYKRSYKKIQTLLTEVMSVINLLFGIGQIICKILLTKKMSKDIVRNILKENENINEINEYRLFSEQNKKSKKIFKDILKNNIYSERKDINQQSKIEKQKIYKKIKLKTKDDIIKNNDMNLKLLKKLSYWNIIKSFFCFKDKKTELINICYNLINEDLCIEGLLKKINKLENIYFLLSEKEKDKFIRNIYIDKKFKEVNNLIFQLKSEIILNNKSIINIPKNLKNFDKDKSTKIVIK